MFYSTARNFFLFRKGEWANKRSVSMVNFKREAVLVRLPGLCVDL